MKNKSKWVYLSLAGVFLLAIVSLIYYVRSMESFGGLVPLFKFGIPLAILLCVFLGLFMVKLTDIDKQHPNTQKLAIGWKVSSVISIFIFCIYIYLKYKYPEEDFTDVVRNLFLMPLFFITLLAAAKDFAFKKYNKII